jgi:hypothetical protein
VRWCVAQLKHCPLGAELPESIRDLPPDAPRTFELYDASGTVVALSRARRQRQQQAATQGGAAAEGLFGDNPLAMFLVRLLDAWALVF